MKILIPTADYPPIEGGISTVALEVARMLTTKGHEITVLAPYFPDTGPFDEAEPYEVHRYAGYRLGWLRFFPMLFTALPLMRRAELILCINIAYAGVMARIAGSLSRTPYVVFAYGYEFLKFKGVWPVSALLRSVYRHARLTVAISDFTRSQLAEFGAAPDGIVTIHPGASLSTPLSRECLAATRDKFALGNDRVILAVGRFVPRKGHLTFVRALPRILEAFPDTVLVLVGQGPAMSDVAKEANALGVRDNVLLPGCLPPDDVAALYECCEIFALPTGTDSDGQVEGFGLVFTEAHAHGKPVVAGHSGGVTEAVLDGETGLIVEPNDPDALAEAILSLMNDPERARRLGENGRRRVEEELNWETFTERLLGALEDCP